MDSRANRRPSAGSVRAGPALSSRSCPRPGDAIEASRWGSSSASDPSLAASASIAASTCCTGVPVKHSGAAGAVPAEATAAPSSVVGEGPAPDAIVRATHRCVDLSCTTRMAPCPGAWRGACGRCCWPPFAPCGLAPSPPPPYRSCSPAPTHHTSLGSTAAPTTSPTSDPDFTPELLRSQVRANIDYLTRASHAQPGLRLHRYNLPKTFRVIATDRACYLTFYSDHGHGRNSPCLYARAPGLLYTSALE
ncbi:hypothetical protein SGRIM119S_02997 [Streptomyces griseorubiginosus]